MGGGGGRRAEGEEWTEGDHVGGAGRGAVGTRLDVKNGGWMMRWADAIVRPKDLRSRSRNANEVRPYIRPALVNETLSNPVNGLLSPEKASLEFIAILVADDDLSPLPSLLQLLANVLGETGSWLSGPCGSIALAVFGTVGRPEPQIARQRREAAATQLKAKLGDRIRIRLREHRWAFRAVRWQNFTFVRWPGEAATTAPAGSGRVSWRDRRHGWQFARRLNWKTATRLVAGDLDLTEFCTIGRVGGKPG